MFVHISPDRFKHLKMNITNEKNDQKGVSKRTDMKRLHSVCECEELLVTDSERLQSFFLLWRLDFMCKQTKGHLWSESTKRLNLIPIETWQYLLQSNAAVLQELWRVLKADRNGLQTDVVH